MLTFRNTFHRNHVKFTTENPHQDFVEAAAIRMDNVRILMDIVDAIREDHPRRSIVRNQLDEMSMKLNDQHHIYFESLCANAWWNQNK